MPPCRLARGCTTAVFALILRASGAAQTCPPTFGPMGASLTPSQSIYYDQYWSVPARGPSGWTFAFCNGGDIYARRFDANLSPLGNQFLVNSTYNLGTQDEPAIAYNTTNGNFLVAWSERYGYDGSAMGIMGRVFDVNGNPLGTEFVINQITFASQWRPLISPTPSGGFLVAWSGDNDGNAYIRLLDANGGFLSGDILVNTYTYDAQVDTSAAENSSGTIFVAFADFSAHGSVGSGINVYGRTFDSAGNPREAQEFPLTSWASDGDQREPRVAVDGLGRFFVVWSDEIADGSGYGIFERVFDRNGVPLLPEFQVTTTTSGNQVRPLIAVDSLGRAVVTFEDDSLGVGSPRIRARRFNAQTNPFGPDFVVNDTPSVGAVLAFPAMGTSATDFVVGWQGPGSIPLSGVDLFARRFQSTNGPQIYCAAKVNSQGCTPAIGFSGSPSATLQSPFLITASSVLNHKLSLLLYGYDSVFTPYQGSLMCVAPPLHHGPTLTSGGTASGTNCTGTLSTDFNAFLRGSTDPRLVPGTTVSARWYYHDPLDPTGFGSGMTDAIRFAICP